MCLTMLSELSLKPICSFSFFLLFHLFGIQEFLFFFQREFCDIFSHVVNVILEDIIKFMKYLFHVS